MARPIPLNPHAPALPAGPSRGTSLPRGRVALAHVWAVVRRWRVSRLPRSGGRMRVAPVARLLASAALMVGTWSWLHAQPSAAGEPVVVLQPAVSQGAPLRRVAPMLAAPVAVAADLPPGGWVAIEGTGGAGLYVRRAPRRSAPVALWPEGVELQVMGPPRTGDGHRWLPVRDPLGHTGWAAAEYLAAAGEPQQAAVGHTGGRGVYLRAVPRTGAPLRTLAEGTLLLVLGSAHDADGQSWSYVRALHGAAGWVASAYLTPSAHP